VSRAHTRDSEETFAIVGGGIAGLSAAWELAGACANSSRSCPTRIVVFESSDRLGGHIRAADVGDRNVDVGPDAFLARRPEAVALCEEIGIDGGLVAPGSSKAFVWSRGSLRGMPAGLVLGAPTRIGPLARSGIVSYTGIARAALDLVLPRTASGSESSRDRSVGEIVSSRLGREVTDSLTGPLVGGINAGRVDDLSAEAVFPALLEASRRGGSLMRALRRASPQPGTPAGVHVAGGATGAGSDVPPVFLAPTGGMTTLPFHLAAALRDRGVEIFTSACVTDIEEIDGRWSLRTSGSLELLADGVVIATPADVAGNILESVDADLARLLSGIRTSSVVVVTFRFGAGSISKRLEGTGFLVPATQSVSAARGAGGSGRPGLMTAATFLSTKWPQLERPNEVLVRASAGRAGDDRAISTDDGSLVETILSELDHVLGGVGGPGEVVVSRFPDSFPQYDVGHLERVSQIEALAGTHPRLALAGASYRGIGIPACIGSGRNAARIVADGSRSAERQVSSTINTPSRSAQ
jgi:protoporphyrinogen/coproporphyrinogen III oxidase